VKGASSSRGQNSSRPLGASETIGEIETELQQERLLMNTLTKGQRATLLELVPAVLAGIEYQKQCQRDGVTPTAAEARQFHQDVVHEFLEWPAQFPADGGTDRALLDWWDRVAEDVLARFARSPNLGKLLALPRRLQ
jgi:hypothetical protein